MKGGDAFLGSAKQIPSDDPFAKRDMAILENRTNLTVNCLEQAEQYRRPARTFFSGLTEGIFDRINKINRIRADGRQGEFDRRNMRADEGELFRQVPRAAFKIAQGRVGGANHFHPPLPMVGFT